MTINRLTGRITLSAVITAAMIAAAGAAGEINVTVDAPIMDRRQQVSAADVATTVAALEALDTFEVPVDGAGGKIRLNVAHDEAQCANVWGGYTSEYPLPTVWEEGHYYEYSNVPTIPISSLELYVGLVNAPTSYHRSEVDYTAMHYPLTPGGPMETIPDGTTIASAYVKMTLSDIDETILTYSKPGGSAESLVSTDHTVGALDSVGVAIIGYRPGEDVPDILFISGGVAAEDDETVLVDVTSFAQEWVNSLRASGEYYGFSLAVIAPELGADPSFDDLSAMLPVFNYSHYEPSHIDCVPYPQPFEEGTPNPNFMDAAWTRTERTLVIGGATIHGVIVTVASLPATVGGKSIADMAPPVNSEHFGRVIRPVVAPE